MFVFYNVYICFFLPKYLVLALQPLTRKASVQTLCFYTFSCKSEDIKVAASHQGAVHKDLVHEL